MNNAIYLSKIIRLFNRSSEIELKNKSRNYQIKKMLLYKKSNILKPLKNKTFCNHFQ